MMMAFGAISIVTMLVYVLLIVLGVMFLFRGYVYFGAKMKADQALLKKLDQLIEKLDDAGRESNDKNE